MNDYLISVVIPVYNGERFIDRSVQSVLCQLEKDVELILVNDGSTDGSGALCDAYAKNHGNIRVIHKENGGISSARNAGIAAAEGAYILFLDADDYLEEQTCGEIRKVIEANHPDCMDFGWRYVSNGEKMAPAFHKLPKNTLLDRQTIHDVILPPLLNLRNDPDHFVFDFSCTKVFRRELIQTHHVQFDESRRVWEDRPFVVQYLRYCENYYAMDKCLYNYVDVPGSLSRKYSLDYFRIILENYQLYGDLYGQQFDFDSRYVNDYWCRAVENMIFRSLEQKEYTDQIRQNILKTLADPQVIHWYTRRNPENAFEKRMSQLVTSGQFEKALLGYEKQSMKQNKAENVRNILRAIKRRVMGNT